MSGSGWQSKSTRSRALAPGLSIDELRSKLEQYKTELGLSNPQITQLLSIAESKEQTQAPEDGHRQVYTDLLNYAVKVAEEKSSESEHSNSTSQKVLDCCKRLLEFAAEPLSESQPIKVTYLYFLHSALQYLRGHTTSSNTIDNINAYTKLFRQLDQNLNELAKLTLSEDDGLLVLHIILQNITKRYQHKIPVDKDKLISISLGNAIQILQQRQQDVLDQLQIIYDNLENSLNDRNLYHSTDNDSAFSPDVQGLIIHPDANLAPNDIGVHTTTLLELSSIKDDHKRWPLKLNHAIRNAAKNKLHSKDGTVKPRVGDIIFFDSENDGTAVIAFGNDLTKGPKGAGRFTHVSIVIDINQDGTALIAEAGGAGVRYMRQATIRHLQSGVVFRPENKDFARHYTQIAFDATRFDVINYFHNIVLTTRCKNQQSFIATIANRISTFAKSDIKAGKSITKDDIKAHLAQKLKEKMGDDSVLSLDSDDLKNYITNIVLEYANKHLDSMTWGKSGYHIVASAPYNIIGMLVSPLTNNRGKQLLTKDLFAARHEPGLRTKQASTENSDFHPWCSLFVMTALGLGFVEMLNAGNSQFPKEASKWVEEYFAKPANLSEEELLSISPKTLYQVLTNAQINGQALFKKVGSFVNVDDYDPDPQDNSPHHQRDARYHNGQPFAKNKFDLVQSKTVSIVDEDEDKNEIAHQQQDNNFINFRSTLIAELEQKKNASRSSAEYSQFINKLLDRIKLVNNHDALLLTVAEMSYKSTPNRTIDRLCKTVLLAIVNKSSIQIESEKSQSISGNINTARRVSPHMTAISRPPRSEDPTKPVWAPVTKNIILGLLLTTGIALTLTGAFTPIGVTLAKFALEGVLFGCGVTLTATAASVKKFHYVVAAVGLILGIGLLMSGIFAPLGFGIAGGVILADAMFGAGALATALGLAGVTKGVMSWLGKLRHQNDATNANPGPELAYDAPSSTSPPSESRRRMSTSHISSGISVPTTAVTHSAESANKVDKEPDNERSLSSVYVALSGSHSFSELENTPTPSPK